MFLHNSREPVIIIIVCFYLVVRYHHVMRYCSTYRTGLNIFIYLILLIAYYLWQYCKVFTAERRVTKNKWCYTIGGRIIETVKWYCWQRKIKLWWICLIIWYKKAFLGYQIQSQDCLPTKDHFWQEIRTQGWEGADTNPVSGALLLMFKHRPLQK